MNGNGMVEMEMLVSSIVTADGTEPKKKKPKRSEATPVGSRAAGSIVSGAPELAGHWTGTLPTLHTLLSLRLGLGLLSSPPSASFLHSFSPSVHRFGSRFSFSAVSP